MFGHRGVPRVERRRVDAILPSDHAGVRAGEMARPVVPSPGISTHHCDHQRLRRGDEIE